MAKWFFTFGCGQKNAGYVQPIIAEDAEDARATMFELHDKHWAFQYSEKEWQKAVKESNKMLWPIETELPVIYSKNWRNRING